MKTWFIIVVTAAIGIVVGTGLAKIRLGLVPWDGNPTSGGMTRLVKPSATAKGLFPKAVIDETEYDFGDMDFNAEGARVFIVHNEGNSPLEISPGGTSCGCTVSDIENELVQPGKSTKITLNWKAKDSSGPFLQTAIILTNDPDQPSIMLTITGRIITALQVAPPEVWFGQATTDQEDAREVELLCLVEKPLEIVSYKLSDQAAAKHFQVVFEPLALDQLHNAGAKSGRMLKVGLKPGLPLGEFNQTILIHTNLESIPTLEVPIWLTIVGNIEIAGPGEIWDSKTQVLKFGTVRGSEGAQQRLWLLVRGPDRKQIKIESEESVPDTLKVSLGEPEAINAGQVMRIPLIVEIPKGSPPANYPGPEQNKLGKITLKTTHPTMPQLSLYVSYQCQE
jgi:hypothetical protein